MTEMKLVSDENKYIEFWVQDYIIRMDKKPNWFQRRMFRLLLGWKVIDQ